MYIDDIKSMNFIKKATFGVALVAVCFGLSSCSVFGGDEQNKIFPAGSGVNVERAVDYISDNQDKQYVVVATTKDLSAGNMEKIMAAVPAGTYLNVGDGTQNTTVMFNTPLGANDWQVLSRLLGLYDDGVLSSMTFSTVTTSTTYSSGVVAPGVSSDDVVKVVGDYYSGLAATDSTLSYGGVKFRSQASGVLRDPADLTCVAQLGVGLKGQYSLDDVTVFMSTGVDGQYNDVEVVGDLGQVSTGELSNNNDCGARVGY